MYITIKIDDTESSLELLFLTTAIEEQYNTIQENEQIEVLEAQFDSNDPVRVS